MFTRTLERPADNGSKTNPHFDKYHEFNSSAVKEAWYSTSDGTLAVAPVHGDKVYHYLNVPLSEWEAFTDAWSAGQFWQTLRNQYGHAEPTYDRPEWEPQAAENPNDRKWTVTVQVSGTVEVSVVADSLIRAVNEVNADLHTKFQDLAVNHEILGVVEA